MSMVLARGEPGSRCCQEASTPRFSQMAASWWSEGGWRRSGTGRARSRLEHGRGVGLFLRRRPQNGRMFGQGWAVFVGGECAGVESRKLAGVESWNRCGFVTMGRAIAAWASILVRVGAAGGAGGLSWLRRRNVVRVAAGCGLVV